MDESTGGPRPGDPDDPAVGTGGGDGGEAAMDAAADGERAGDADGGTEEFEGLDERVSWTVPGVPDEDGDEPAPEPEPEPEAAEDAPPKARSRAPLWAGAAALLLVAVAGGVWALGPSGSSCDGAPVQVAVGADPGIASTLRGVADRFNVEEHHVGTRCVRVTVTDVASADYVRRAPLRARYDVWVPESGLWLGPAREAGANRVPPLAPTLVGTPVVLAAPKAAGVDTGGTWKALLDGGLSRRSPDPAASMPGAVAMLALKQVAAGDVDAGLGRALGKGVPLAGLLGPDRGERPLLVTTEQAVLAYNEAHRPNPVEPTVPKEGTVLLDYPFAVTTADAARREGAQALLTALGTRPSRDALQAAGFRTPQGTFDAARAERFAVPAARPKTLAPPTRAALAAAFRAWR
ncbi:substrate-binding domain-containing protein [Actinomadura parmotrematis]|uniref:Substrate-binding domain-containing protein n=1 Tax=Actinomadura parmotrematis TaxID=2864039 RepID=A0ABS7FW06_9ACTN|nr:substrate-binding domain-containing protein [Actinomadura parmotrematis]MBW8484604.1 substrate-binding domain-containing protein [Actinomadura parmotrematis]